MATLEERRATLEEFHLFRDNLFNDGHNTYEMLPWLKQGCISLISILERIQHLRNPAQFEQCKVFAKLVKDLFTFIRNDMDLCLEEINRYLHEMLQISHELDEESNDLWLFLVEGLNILRSKFASTMLRYWAEHERYRNLLSTVEGIYGTILFEYGDELPYHAFDF